MQMMHISVVKPFPMLCIKIQRTETLYLTCLYDESMCISASLLSLEVKVKVSGGTQLMSGIYHL